MKRGRVCKKKVNLFFCMCVLGVATLYANDTDKLFEAIGNGDTVTAQDLINSGMNINVSDGEKTPLTYAVYCNNYEITRMLIEKGADLEANILGERQVRPLLMAVLNQNIEIVKILLSYGANVNAREPGMDSTPLHHAVGSGNIDITQELLSYEANLEARTNERAGRITPLFGVPDIDTLQLLIDWGVNINSRGSGGTILITKAINGDYDAVALLLEAGADVHIKDDDGNTALHAAVIGGSPAFRELDMEISGNTTTTDNMPGRHIEVMELLLEYGADISIEDYTGNTPLATSIRSEYKAAENFLRRQGAY